MEELIKIGLADNFNHLGVLKSQIDRKLSTGATVSESEINELWVIINSLNEARNNLIQLKK